MAWGSRDFLQACSDPAAQLPCHILLQKLRSTTRNKLQQSRRAPAACELLFALRPHSLAMVNPPSVEMASRLISHSEQSVGNLFSGSVTFLLGSTIPPLLSAFLSFLILRFLYDATGVRTNLFFCFLLLSKGSNRRYLALNSFEGVILSFSLFFIFTYVPPFPQRPQCLLLHAND